eukprot:scaffold39488_cov25-Prasinocladus_malaysianus.AAC.1
MENLQPTWRGVARHVCRSFAEAVKDLESSARAIPTLKPTRPRVRATSSQRSQATTQTGPAELHVSDLTQSVKVLEWAKAQGCPWDSRVCAAAAGGGHLTTLRWARQNGCPWSAETCARAAAGGHLSILQYARQHSRPLNEMHRHGLSSSI